jgi:hypothetical protein
METSHTEDAIKTYKRTIWDFYVHVTVHRNKFLFNKTNRRINISKFIFVKKRVEFLDKNKFGKINVSVGFTKKIIWDVLKAVPNSLHPTAIIYFRIRTSISHLFSLPQAVVLPSLSHLFHVPILLALMQK